VNRPCAASASPTLLWASCIDRQCAGPGDRSSTLRHDRDHADDEREREEGQLLEEQRGGIRLPRRRRRRNGRTIRATNSNHATCA
jgi:hypothetical protein